MPRPAASVTDRPVHHDGDRSILGVRGRRGSRRTWEASDMTLFDGIEARSVETPDWPSMCSSARATTPRPRRSEPWC